jgi:hypothetical protein
VIYLRHGQGKSEGKSEGKWGNMGAFAPALAAAGTPGTTRRFAATPTSWTPLDDLPMGEWAEQGRRLGTIGRAVGWWIGDWLRYGNARFGERYTRASRITGYDVQTLMNIVYVATSVDPKRRRPELSFSHHAEVASLSAEEQDRWLERARSDRLSVRCLREELRRERRALRQESESSQADGAPALVSVPTDPPSAFVCPQCGCHIHSEAETAAAASA